MKSLCFVIFFLSHAVISGWKELDFKVISLRPTVSMNDWDSHKKGLAELQGSSDKYDVLIYLLQDVVDINEGELEAKLGLKDGFRSKVYVNDNFATVIAFKDADVIRDVFETLTDKEVSKTDGSQKVWVELQGMHYLFVNTSLDQDKNKANEQFMQVYSDMTEIKNKVNFKTHELKAIKKENGDEWPIDEDDDITIVWAGSFANSIPREKKAEFKEAVKSADTDVKTLASTVKEWVNGGTGPLAKWKKKDNDEFEDLNSKKDVEALAKTPFIELPITFDPTRGYEVKDDDAVWEDEENPSYGDLVTKEELSYTDRILYYTTTTQDDFEAYEMLTNCSVSTSKALQFIIKDAQAYEDGIEERVKHRRVERKLSLLDRIKQFL